MPPLPLVTVRYTLVPTTRRTEYRYCWLFLDRWHTLNTLEAPEQLASYFDGLLCPVFHLETQP